MMVPQFLYIGVSNTVRLLDFINRRIGTSTGKFLDINSVSKSIVF